MADIKREDITLSDWTKGISADEFVWGSYFYSDGIQTWYSTKWFKLWPYIETKSLNNRTEWYPLAVSPCMWSMISDSNNFVVFTADWQIEMGENLNWSVDWEWWSAWGGAIYNNPTNFSCRWWIVYWDYALWFWPTFIKKIPFKDTYSLNGQTIVNPRFENSAAWWTVWSGWTLTDDWMEHTIWQTWTLSVVAEAYDTWRERMAIKVTNCTAWNVTVDIDGHQDIETESWRNWWFIWSQNTITLSSWSNYTITVTPTSDFDWTIEAVNFNVYKPAVDSVSNEIGWLTSASKHMAIAWGWDIFITSWDTIDVLSTLDWKISASKKIINSNETIVAITQQADSLIIWATDGIDSHQYYWNWVDSIATEVIEWKWQVIKAATWTEIVSYVLAWVGTSSAWYAYRLYSVSGYQRSLIASNAYKVQSGQWNLSHYHPSKKFAFNDVQWPESLAVYMDNLYIPWCDWIYQFWQTLPWLSNAWSRPIRYKEGADKLFLFQNGDKVAFLYRDQQKTYYAMAINWRYTDKWYLVTDSLYWDKMWTKKSLEKIKLWYKSIPFTDWIINVYAIVDDDYFWRFDVSWVTNRPSIWDIYEVAEDTTAEVIRIEKSSSSKWTITLRTVNNGWSLTTANRYLEKVSGDGDASIDSQNNYDNMCLIKTIQEDKQWYNSDLIFWKDFVNSYLPYWYKIQFVIELVKYNTLANSYRTPEIYDLWFISDIDDTIL